ncbi:hypothetical protein CHUAL_012235 [Chamberlinius hualienensis]
MMNSRVSSFSLNSSSASRIRKSLAVKSSQGIRAGANTSRTVGLNASTYAVEESSSHLVESFGIPLPVLVTEAITLAERSREVSARLDISSWAWLVCGRRLFIWKYKLGPDQQLAAAPLCRELTLPPSDVAHKADLVCILPSSDKQVPAVLAVSPEGTIRYWPSIAHDGSSIEINADLQGQECFSLINCRPYGCILSTTTNTLILVSPTGYGKETSLVCRNLTVSKGVLARLSRRMTSFIFGAVPNQNLESRLVRVITSNDQNEAKNLFILSESSMQRWELNGDEGEKLIFNHDIDYLIREKFIENLWSRDLLTPQQLQLWLIDMQLHKTGIFILAGVLHPREPLQIRYALALVNPNDLSLKDFKSFTVIPHIDSFQDASDDFMLSYRLLIPNAQSDCGYVYRNNIILCVSLTVSSDESDKIEFRRADDHILGAGAFNGVPLFLTHKHGIVCVKSRPLENQSATSISKLDDSAMAEAADLVFGASATEEIIAGDDKIAQLKSALLAFCSKNMAQSHVVINKYFPTNLISAVEDSSLDNAVVALSRKTIDDYPVVDPRWAETVSQESAVSSSLIILHQLEDKRKAHQLIVDFLRQCDIWERLRAILVNNQLINTRQIICEHAEKLEAARNLRNLHSQYGSLIESAIKLVLRARRTMPSGKLTNQDMFYREVSHIQDIIPALIKVEEEHLSYGSTETIVNTVQSTNRIILTMLRSRAYELISSPEGDIGVPHVTGELTTWNASIESSLLRALLIQQHGITLNRGISLAQDPSTRETLLQNVMDLTDLVLDGFEHELQLLQRSNVDVELSESIVHQYHQERSNLISSLLKLDQHEKAASLAEKYLDFDILVGLCEATNNQSRLNRYIIQFADKGFSDFTFNWYIKEGKRGKLLSQTAFQQDNLKQFLKNHNDLSWLNDINQARYTEGCKTLKSLGLAERSLLSRKKTFLSLSKLFASASELPHEEIDNRIQELNEEQNLILYQETLPMTVLECYGLDIDSMRVLTPVELIEMYISDDNVNANEYDYKKALDLLHFVKKPDEYKRLSTRIWCRAILRDDWNSFDTDKDPLEICSRTVFFQAIELVFNDNMNLRDLLPDIKIILENEELGSLRENTKFSYFLQVGYEQIMRVTS